MVVGGTEHSPLMRDPDPRSFPPLKVQEIGKDEFSVTFQDVSL